MGPKVDDFMLSLLLSQNTTGKSDKEKALYKHFTIITVQRNRIIVNLKALWELA
jgi:hypothetical protein